VQRKIYIDFFTSLAVAWFAGGVIAPIFAPELGLNKIPLMTIGILGSFVLLQFAVIIGEGGKIK